MISTEIKNRMKKDDDDKLKNASSQDSIFKKVGSAVQQASAAKQQAVNKAREQVATAANTATQSATKSVKKSAFDAAYETATQQVKNAAAEQRARQVAQFATPASTQPQKTYTATMSSGKQYTFDEDAANWIINRYMQDNADSYGLDDADQLAKKNGQFSAAMRKTYKNTNVDRELAAMGLPSEKYFEKYLGEYGNWKTGGMDDYFGSMNLPNDYWTKNKSYYQEDWQNAYENTAEDQQRKAAGLMPAKYEAKYTDTEIDDQLRARGLPPVSEFYTYRDKYNAGQEKDALYANAALAQTNLRLAGIKNDDTTYPDGNGGEIKGKDLYAQAFYNEARRTNEDGTYVYGNIMPNFQSGTSSTKTPELTGDYATDQANQLLAEIKSATKEASPTDSNSWNYDDYLAHYDDYYNKYFANETLPETNQLVSDAIAAKEREADAEATREYYDVDNSWFGEAKKGLNQLVSQYQQDHPTATHYDMFSDFLKNGVSLINVRKAARAMQNAVAKATGKNSDFYEISSALAQAEKNWAHTEDLDAIYGVNGYDVVEGKVIPKGATPVESTAVPEDAKTFFNFGDAYANASKEYDVSAESARAEQKALRRQQRLANRAEPESKTPEGPTLKQTNDAIQVYREAEALYEEAMAGKGAPTEADRAVINTANEFLNTLGFTSIHAAERHRDSLMQSESVEEDNEQLKKDVTDAIRELDDAKADAELKGDSKSFQKVIDAEQKVMSLLNVGSADAAREWLRTGELPEGEASFNGTAITVDNAIKVVETYMEQNGGWNAKVAQQAFNELYRMGVSPDIISQAAAEMQDRFGEMEETFTEPEPPDKPGLDSMLEYVENNKDIGTDENTVNDTKKALERLLFDEDGNNIALTNADSVIKAIDSVRNMPFTTPAAVDLALKDLGFSANGWFSGVAEDLTNGWSTDEMVKLRLALGEERAVDVNPDDYLPDDAKFIQDTFGLSDFWMGNPVSPSQKILDLDGFATRLDWANQQIAAGTLTPGQAYNVLAEDGYQDELEILMGDEWHKAHFKEYMAPGLWAQSTEPDRLLWDEMTEAERDAKAELMWEAMSDEQKAAMYGDPSWWKYDPTVKRTAGQAWMQQAAATLPGLITQLISTPITIADSVDALITGRPETWDITKQLTDVEQALSNYGSVDDFSFGTRTAEWVTSAAQELIKMETLGTVGGMVGEAFKGTGVGSKILKATVSNSKIVSKVADMFMGAVQASPFVAESFAGHYREAKMKGLPNGLAAWYGAVTGLSEGLIEGFNFDKIWGKAIGSDKIVERLMQGGLDYLNMGINGQALLSSLALGFLGEGTEEFVGYAVETGMKNAPSLSPYFSDEEKAWSWKDAGEQALVGGILGVLGAGMHSGSVTTRALITDYAIDKGDAELFRKVAPELAYSIGVAESLSESDLGMYKKGGAKIMSLQAYDNVLDQIKDCENGIEEAKADAARIEADLQKPIDAAQEPVYAAQKTVDAAQNEVDKYGFQMMQYMDTQYDLPPEALNELADLESKQTSAEVMLNDAKAKLENAKRAAEDAKRTATEDAKGKLQKAQNHLESVQKRQANLQKQIQEHWVGIYLQNYNGLINGMTDEMVSNIAQAYQNGAKYEASKESSADIEVKAEAQSEVNDLVSQLKSNKQRLKSADVATRAFTDADEQSVKDAAKNIGYKGNVSFINDPNEKWSGKFNKNSGDIVLNRAYLTAYDVDGLQNNPAMWVLQHEMYHYVKEVGGEEFTKAAVKLIKGLPKFARLGADVSEAAYNQMLDTIAEKWTGLGINADDDVQTKRAKAEEELVAKFAETYLFGSESSIKMLAQTNGNIVEKMLGWLRYRIDELKLRRSKESYAKDILKLERMYAKALRDANEKFKPQKNGSTNTVEKSESTAQNTGKPVSDESYSAANVDIEELLDDEEEYAEPEIANPRTGVTKDQDAVYSGLVKKVLEGKARPTEKKMLSNMIADLAKRMGFDTVVYHGTKHFGFTKPDTSKSDDKLSFFGSSTPWLGRTYIPAEYLDGGESDLTALREIRNAGEGSQYMLSEYRNKRLQDLLMGVFTEAYMNNPNRQFGLLTDNVIEKKSKRKVGLLLDKLEDVLHGETPYGWVAYHFRDAVDEELNKISSKELSQESVDALNKMNDYIDLEKLDEEETSVIASMVRERLRALDDETRSAVLGMVADYAMMYGGIEGYGEEQLVSDIANAIAENGDVGRIDEFLTEPLYDSSIAAEYEDSISNIETLRDTIEASIDGYLYERSPENKNKKSGGTYKFYANTDNMYVVGDDNNWQRWSDIRVPDDVAKEMMSMGIFPTKMDRPNNFKTRAIAKWAKEKGYSGVIYKNIRDNGGQAEDERLNEYLPPETVYNFFNPQTQLRSADEITLDDNYELIPYSERFDPENGKNDFRYSRANFDIDDLLNEYGAIEPGRNPLARDVQVPRQTNDMNRVSQWIRSLIESGKLTDDQAQNVLRMVVEQDYGTYVPTSQAERMEEARAYIAERQPLQAQQEFHDMVMSGKFGVKTNALGIQLLSDASARGDIASVLDIAADLQLAATEAGQSAQIFNVLKELKGVGSAWYMQKVIDRMNSKYADRIKAGKMNRISVDPALMAELAKATTVDQMAAAEEAVAKDIARQLPLTWDDRLSSWRYFSMLANPTTHIRNITGNLLMKGLNAAKDVTAVGVQRVAEKLGLATEADRAHALLNSADKSTWANFVQRSYEEQARNLSGGSKLGFESFVKQNMRSFDTKWLNALAQFNFKALEGEDIAFIKPAYKNALMQYMVAQGYTLNEKGQAGKVNAKGEFTAMTKAQMNEAIDWASQQAWKQTFRDASSLATMLNKLSKENAVSRLLVEGVMPFKKTPINIARRGVDYSPAGIIKGIAQLTNGVKKGKVTAAQAIDTLSSGITGSALMALGVMLAKLGVIRAGGEKDKKLETFLEDTGDQTYAMKFGDKSINMSSIAPATIPLFMGVALNEMIEQGGDTLDLSTITDTIAGTLNPFMEMSFMASLNSALKNYNTNGIGGALGSTLLTAAQNYGSQYLPTLGGKIAQFIDPTRRTTKSDITSPVGSNMDYYARSLAKKVPGLESTLQPDVDVWGRTDTKDTFGEWAWDFANKFILPTNVKTTNRDAVDNELIRVVESTGVTDFLPSDGNKYFQVNKKKYEMNAKQYAQYSQERGQAAYAAIKDVMASASYKNASDEQKAELLKKAKDAAYKAVNTIWKEKLGAYDN